MSILRKKLVIVGDGACGKTCLFSVFAKNIFPETFIPKVFEGFVAALEVDGRSFELALWDTASQVEYEHLRPLSYWDADVLLMCYSIDSPDSLRNLEEMWVPEVRHFCPGVPIILVGNREDIRYNQDCIQELAAQNMEPVTREYGQMVASRIGASDFIECSAKEKKCVKAAFEAACRATIKPRKVNTSRRCSLL